MSSIAIVSEYLESYEGRDKFLRILSYMAKLASGIPSNSATKGLTSENLKKLGSELSKCRVILRLLDDVPALHAAITHQWCEKTKKSDKTDWLVKWTETLQILVDLIYCPVEHITYFGQLKLVNINVESWDDATTWFWLFTINLSLIRSIRRFRQLGIEYKNKCTSLEKKPVVRERRNQLLTCVRLLFDMSYAIAYLPEGILWGGKLKTWQIGALGTISSFMSLYQALSKRAQNSKT